MVVFETRHSEAQMQWDFAAMVPTYQAHFRFDIGATPEGVERSNYQEGLPINCAQASREMKMSPLSSWKFMLGRDAEDALVYYFTNTSMNGPRAYLLREILVSLIAKHGYPCVRVLFLTTY
jgi:hypothetical protein